jgi:hypothetical protein
MRQGLDYEFDRVCNDVLSLHKPDGRVFENIKARVSTKGILIMDVSLPIEVGDKLLRTLPSGLKEMFVVDDPVYCAPLAGLPAHFQIKVHRAGADQLAGPVVSPKPQGTREAPPVNDGSRMKPGPRPDIETAVRALDSVTRVAGAAHWKNKLDEICNVLDQDGIPVPKTWKKNHGLENWTDAAESERDLAKKAIAHHLKVAKTARP